MRRLRAWRGRYPDTVSRARSTGQLNCPGQAMANIGVLPGRPSNESRSGLVRSGDHSDLLAAAERAKTGANPFKHVGAAFIARRWLAPLDRLSGDRHGHHDRARATCHGRACALGARESDSVSCQAWALVLLLWCSDESSCRLLRAGAQANSRGCCLKAACARGSPLSRAK